MSSPGNIVVLGAGISGLISVQLLLEQGHAGITVIDTYPTLGGNHISEDIGPFTFDIGAFLFRDNDAFFRYFPSLLPSYHQVKDKIERVTPAGHIRRYPFAPAAELFSRGPREVLLTGLSLLWGRLRYARPANVDEYCRNRMGSRLYESSGLEGYLERFYGLPPHLIEVEFALKRMTWVTEATSLRRMALTRLQRIVKLIRRSPAKRKTRILVRPRAGFSPLYTGLQKELEAQGVTFLLGKPIRSIRRTKAGFDIKLPNRTVTASRLISTMPLNVTAELCGLPPSPALRTVELVSLYYSFSGERGFTSAILYNFTRLGPWKRLTMMSDYYGKAKSKGKEEEYFTLEINRQDAAETIEGFDAAFRADAKAKGLFNGKLTLQGHHSLSNAYPVYAHGATQAAADAVAALKTFGIESFGRQGGFEYLPSVKSVITSVRNALGTR